MIYGKKILAVIPARGGSKGIKLKNLKKIKKISLVGIVGKFIDKCKFFDNAVISTDNSLIAKEGIKYNLSVVQRPFSLSGDRVPDTKVFIHATLKAERLFNTKFDIAVMLHPTSPLRKINDVRNSINKLIKFNCDSVWTISSTDSKFHPYKQLNLKNQKISYFYKVGHKIVYRQQLSKIYHRNSVAYVVNRNFLIKKKKIISNKTFGHITRSKQISIDTLDDLRIAEKNLNFNF